MESIEEKGKKGEELVLSTIENIVNNRTGREISVFNNIILEYPSLYGNGRMTTEIDHVVVAEDKIIIIETKNADYKDAGYSDETWTLSSNKETSNPIRQNRTHKEIFCSLLEIGREEVYTVECLVNYKKPELKTPNPNDYVFGFENMKDNFTLLFESCFPSKDYEPLKQKLRLIEKKSESLRAIHSKNLRVAEDIEEWTKKHEGDYEFKRTDTAFCSKCGGKMFFKMGKWVDYERGNKNSSRQCMIGCENRSKTTRLEHDGFFYRNKSNEGFKKVKVISLNDRMGWSGMEESKPTILDKFYKQEQHMKELERKINEKEREIREKEDSIDKKSKSIQNLQKENETILNQFSKIIGPLYIKKKA